MTTDQITEPDRLVPLADMADAAWQTVRRVSWGMYSDLIVQTTKELRDMDAKRHRLTIYLAAVKDSLGRAYAEAKEFDEAATARKVAVKATIERKATEAADRDDSFTQSNDSGLAPGIYLTDPQGHALVVDDTRRLAIVDLGGLVTIGGVKVADPVVLDQVADRLHMLADRLRTRAGM